MARGLGFEWHAFQLICQWKACGVDVDEIVHGCAALVVFLGADTGCRLLRAEAWTAEYIAQTTIRASEPSHV